MQHAMSEGQEQAEPRPAEICAFLLQAMGASEGRRQRRKRDTTPDALGMEIKRGLLAEIVAADPDVEEFDAWLFARVQAEPAAGATRAMALQIRDEWEFAVATPGFRAWLGSGAPSDDGRAAKRD